MDSQKAYITRVVKIYDRDLFCDRNRDGILSVMRKYKKYRFEARHRGVNILAIRDNPQHVLSLTDNWQLNGAPRNWGSEHVLNRLREMDAWSSKYFFEEIERRNEKVDESKMRDFRNKTEAALYESASSIRKGFSDINTANMDKQKLRY